MTVASDLAGRLVQTRFEDLPPLALERARMVITSTLASAAAGSTIGSAAVVRELARERSGRPDATIWFDLGDRLPLADVARVNAMMSDAAASDDSDLRTIAHIGTIITAASIATAERTNAGGAAVLRAMVLGYEAAGRIGDVIRPAYMERGFHGCVITVFGGVTACGLLLGLGQAQLAQALGIAASSIGGLATAADTSLAREYHAGLSAMLGLQAALAAQKGYEVEPAIFETRRGFFETFGGRPVDGVTADWGGDWDIATDMAIKLVPGSHSYHAAAEAAVNAARAGNVDPDQIERITVSGPQFSSLRGPRHPADLIQMAHSIAYFLAAAAVDKDFSWQHAGPEKIADARIQALAEKVQAGGADEQADSRHHRGATVAIAMNDGRRYTSTVPDPRGSGPRGIDWADVDAKYRSLLPLAGVPDERIEQSLGIIHDFERLTSMSELLRLL
jgi:2-methylcitrate dehydratase PrpD